MTTTHRRLGVRRGERLNRIAFPMGGIGAGMLSLEGTGALSQVSLRKCLFILQLRQIIALMSP